MPIEAVSGKRIFFTPISSSRKRFTFSTSGVPSPVKRPELTDMVIFRENTEDIYAGIEWMAGTPEADKVKRFLVGEMGVKKIRFPETSSIGIKPVSKEGTERLVKAALD